MIIYWFRQDLRLTDNPALFHAAAQGELLPVYILEDDNRMGAASRVWLHHSLQALNQQLNGHLAVYAGDPERILLTLAKEHQSEAIYWNRRYEPWARSQDQLLEKRLQAEGIELHSYGASLLWEPSAVLKKDQTPYKVFTPYYKACLQAAEPRYPLPKPEKITCLASVEDEGIGSLQLLPDIAWDKKMMAGWSPGELGAQTRWQEFKQTGLSHYKKGRDFPALKHTSYLSPHLHFGEISPCQLWHEVHEGEQSENHAHFCSELGWREFSYYLLSHFPDLPKENWNKRFDAFPWEENADALTRWQKGMTGYPLVDAGMRQLWQTGYMHNRIRMVVGSFLVKNLLLHWHHGEAWFWECLLDADLASNSASWQWVAGCGADAAPYFRIFNPVMQGHKFDPEGSYTKTYVPELAKLPIKYLFSPWEAPDHVLKEAGIVLDETYPAPVVELRYSRDRALEAYQSLKATL